MEVINGLSSPSGGSKGEVLEKELFSVTGQHPTHSLPRSVSQGSPWTAQK